MSNHPAYHIVMESLRPVFPWMVGVLVALNVAALLLVWRFLVPLNAFLSHSDWVLLKTYQMEQDLTPDQFIERHAMEKAAG